MGNILIDLDQVFSKFQFTYLDVYKKHDYEMAASLLYQLNCNLPLDARVLDMEQYKAEGRTLKHELANFNNARDYCDIWSPLVWSSIADYRTRMLSNLQD